MLTPYDLGHRIFLTIVYTESIPVKGLKERLSTLPDGSLVPVSVYVELLGPERTRDYVPSDSFNRINWIASARKQKFS
ncbi:DUF58 domain-containing protein [Neobacillus jeddahensis]|uniref:DUF58 domain-containing protein n=1 Tax=Neobacillus jeddahensis TaxID=1461580 RepID=UPI0009445724